MKIRLLMNGERYANAEIDDALIAALAGDDVVKRAQAIASELVPYIVAMLELDAPRPAP